MSLIRSNKGDTEAKKRGGESSHTRLNSDGAKKVTLGSIRSTLTKIKEEGVETKRECDRRGRNIQNIGSITQVLLTLCHTVDRGELSQSDVDTFAPPTVRGTKSDGSLECYEYIRSSLTTVRAQVIRLNNSILRLERIVSDLSVSFNSEDELEGVGEVVRSNSRLLVEDLNESFRDLGLNRLTELSDTD
jgi:hypothetical protein